MWYNVEHAFDYGVNVIRYCIFVHEGDFDPYRSTIGGVPFDQSFYDNRPLPASGEKYISFFLLQT